MNPNSGDYRRFQKQASYRRISRHAYLIRAHEFAHKKNRKLNKATVIAIRENRHGLTDKQQAEKYSVHPHTIYKIRHRITYANI